MPVTQPNYHRSGRNSHSLEGMLMCPLRGFSVLRDSVNSSGYKALVITPKCTFTISQWARWILQASEPGWESKDAISVSLSAG